MPECKSILGVKYGVRQSGPVALADVLNAVHRRGRFKLTTFPGFVLVPCGFYVAWWVTELFLFSLVTTIKREPYNVTHRG